MRLDVEARTGCTAAAEIITQLNKEKNIYNIKNKNEKKPGTTYTVNREGGGLDEHKEGGMWRMVGRWSRGRGRVGGCWEGGEGGCCYC